MNQRVSHFIEKEVQFRIFGLQILEGNEIPFIFVPTWYYKEILELFCGKISDILILSFTEKAINEKIDIPKGTILGCLYPLAQFEKGNLY